MPRTVALLACLAGMLALGAHVASADANIDLDLNYLEGLAVDPTTQRVFLSGSPQDTIEVLAFDGTRIGSIDNVSGVRGLAVSAGVLYAARTSMSLIDKYDASTLTKLGAIDVSPSAPRKIAVVGGKVWFCSGGLGSVDTAGTEAAALYTGANYPSSCEGFASNPADPNMLVAYATSSTVFKYSIIGTSPSHLGHATLPYTTNLIDLSITPDGAKFITAAGAPTGRADEWNLADFSSTGHSYQLPSNDHLGAVEVIDRGPGFVAIGYLDPDVLVFPIGGANPVRTLDYNRGWDPSGAQGLIATPGGSTLFAVVDIPIRVQVISQPTNAPAISSIVPPASLSSAVELVFSEPVKGLTQSNMALRLGSSSKAVSATVNCFDGAANVSCASGPATRAVLKNSSSLVPGHPYSVFVNPSGAPPSIDMEGLPAESAQHDFRASLDEEETSLGGRYVWRAVANSNAYGGTFTVERYPGASASFPFNGSSITWYSMLGPDQGIASVYIDGVYRGGFNHYSATRRWKVAHSYGGLSAGPHTIRIVNRGQKGSPKGTDTQVTVDAFKAGSTLYPSPNPFAAPYISYGFQSIGAANASGGRYVRSNLGGASAFFTFYGSLIDWYTFVGPGYGKVTVYIDGRPIETVDMYHPSQAPALLSFEGPEGLHTIRVLNTGQRNARATSTLMAVDGWAVDDFDEPFVSRRGPVRRYS